MGHNRKAALAAAALTLAGAFSAAAPNPIVEGNARFTVHAPECIRLEYQPDAQFVDAPSMFAAGRDALYNGATVTRDSGLLRIDTGRMRLSYKPDGQPFSPANLNVVVTAGEREVLWTPDSKQAANLGGTINTLDQVKGPVDLREGILSRDGWYLLDDSKSALLVDGWVQPRPAGAGTDWYLFGYGTDYAAAFRAFTAVGGKVPMPRKMVLGSWYSRWWKYTTEDYHDIVNEYKQHDFPLDIIVMDMEWHTAGWTGWTWNRELLPDPPALLKWFHDQGLSVTLNVHPADGVQPKEEVYAGFMRRMGQDATTTGTLTFDAGSRKYMETFFDATHAPLEEEGVDFWWLDWQQYPEVKGIPGLLNLSWLNKLYFDNSMRTGKRGLQFSRWGGWGDHRHPIQFSGDADTGWPMLGFEVPFTSTAANQGAYYWSHDIGGHFGDRNEEPYTRWVQFAATTAAMRLHSGIIEYLDRRPWKWPDWATNSMRGSFHLRSQLLPYIYSAARETNETGLPLNRPMYIGWPGEAAAYAAPQQYMFGRDLLVAPVASAGVGPGRVASQLVWFPEGEWRNYFTSESVTGPQWRLVCADIDEWPMYVRAGAPLPMQPYSDRPTTAKLETLVVRVWPGADGSRQTGNLYEDDGISRAYEAGGYSQTLLSSNTDGDAVGVTVDPTAGTFEGQVEERAFEIVFCGMEKPEKAFVNGEEAAAEWSEADRIVTVRVAKRSVREPLTVRVIAKRTHPEVFAERALARRLQGIFGTKTDTSSLGTVIESTAVMRPDLLAGVVALAGFGTVDNQTHYPFVGTMQRLVRNVDSPISPHDVTIAWRRVPDEGGQILNEKKITLQVSTGPTLISQPEPFSAPQFLQNAHDERVLTFTLNSKPMSIRQSLGEAKGTIEEWLVSQAYPYDRKKPLMLQNHPPENLTTQELRALEPELSWKKVVPDDKGIVDLLKAIGGEDLIAYAVGTFDADKAGDAVLGFRSDDGIEAWLNGDKIHAADVLRGINHPWEEVPVKLVEGRNVLLVKVSQASNDWGFAIMGRLGKLDPKTEKKP